MQVEDGEVFDSLNYSKYKENIWNSKYKAGLYFSAMEELGQELVIRFGLKKKNEEGTKWFKTPHALHDGYSALRVLAREQDFSLDLPKFSYRPPKSPSKSILAALKSSPKETHQFKDQGEITNSTDFEYLRMEFPIVEMPFSETALFSKVACLTLMEMLTLNNSSRWMIPVRLRDTEGLQASYLGLEIKKESTVEKLHAQLVDKLKVGEHWGFSYLSKLGLLLGKKAIIHLTKANVLKEKTIWMGVISNLGDLGHSTDLEELSVLAAVRWHRPVGIVMYKHNGKQVLNFTFHKSLGGLDTNEISKRITEVHRSYL